MCFTDFPTETHDEALETLDFLGDRSDRLAVYIVGEFGLTHGSLVAQSPSQFGIRETWELEGDHLGLGIFFAPEHPWKTDDERADVNEQLEELSTGWALRTYPWAGAVSTAHTILYYDRLGASVFRDLAARGLREEILGTQKKAFEADLRFDPRACCARRGARGRDLGDARERAAPRRPRALRGARRRRRRRSARSRCASRSARARSRLPVARAPKGGKARGRRPSHASNATRS